MSPHLGICRGLTVSRLAWLERSDTFRLAAAKILGMKRTVAVVAFVGIAVSAVGVYPAAQGGKSQWDGVYTEAQAKRGEGLYSQYCASCHGPELTGGEMAPGLTGGEFRANWNDLSVGDLFERIRVSMPQNAPGSLSRQQDADILAFVLLKGGFPAGQAELPTQTDVLNSIKFTSAKP
jgi:quinoprotein glucose dehydrogenase